MPLCCADHRSPPAVTEIGHASGEFLLSHVPKDAIRPDVRSHSVGGPPFLATWRADPGCVRSTFHRGRRITLVNGGSMVTHPRQYSLLYRASIIVSVKQIPIVRTLYGHRAGYEELRPLSVP